MKNTIDGMVKNRIVRLAPRNKLIYPKVKVLKIAPIALIDPIHESWSFVNGPDFKGVSFDNRIGVAGEIQPNFVFQLLSEVYFIQLINNDDEQKCEINLKTNQSYSHGSRKSNLL